MASAASGLALLQRGVRGAAIAFGGGCTFVTFASLVGVVTDNAWARAIAALVLSVAVPVVIADRALKERDLGKSRAGLLGDVIAIVLLGIPLLFIGLGQPFTRPLLLREADRLAEAGREIPAHAVYWLAGVRPVDELPTSAPSSAPSPRPSASASGG